ncbi:hypothetical protein JL720_4515 [Aureococcus anophagefferens]|nr:hypothetical protein JL720_4515 [Aureococcus anophagefferens]
MNPASRKFDPEKSILNQRAVDAERSAEAANARLALEVERSTALRAESDRRDRAAQAERRRLEAANRASRDAIARCEAELSAAAASAETEREGERCADGGVSGAATARADRAEAELAQRARASCSRPRAKAAEAARRRARLAAAVARANDRLGLCASAGAAAAARAAGRAATTDVANALERLSARCVALGAYPTLSRSCSRAPTRATTHDGAPHVETAVAWRHLAKLVAGFDEARAVDFMAKALASATAPSPRARAPSCARRRPSTRSSRTPRGRPRGGNRAEHLKSTLPYTLPTTAADRFWGDVVGAAPAPSAIPNAREYDFCGQRLLAFDVGDDYRCVDYSDAHYRVPRPHFALRVSVDDYESTTSRLRSRGVAISDDGPHDCFFKDPSNNNVYLSARVADDVPPSPVSVAPGVDGAHRHKRSLLLPRIGGNEAPAAAAADAERQERARAAPEPAALEPRDGPAVRRADARDRGADDDDAAAENTRRRSRTRGLF